MKGNKIGANLEINKDDNIHKSKAKIMYKLVAKLRKYRILFKDILTFLKLDYRDDSHKILYLVIL